MHFCRYNACVAVLILGGELTASAQQKGPAPVVVAPVVRRKVRAAQSFVGTVRPTRTSVVGSAVDGRVAEFPVNEGDRVEAGATLARLRTRTLELERDAAKATADALREELRELENGSRPEEKDQARARQKAAEAKLRYAVFKRDRSQRLYKANRTLSVEQLQEAESLAEQARQEKLEADAALKLTLAGPRKERIAQTRAKLRSQEALVERFNDRLKLHTLKALFAGYVSGELTEKGQWVKQGDLVAEVVELDEVDVEIPVVEDVISRVRIGTPATVGVPAVPDRVFTGSVKLIVPQADVKSRTVPVKIRVVNEFVEFPTGNRQPVLKSNMFARVKLALGEERERTLVSKDAIVLGGPTPSVYVFEPKGENGQVGAARLVPVRLGAAAGRLVEVLGLQAPLRPGQLVVVRGNERVRPGQPLRVTEQVEPDAAPKPASLKP